MRFQKASQEFEKAARTFLHETNACFSTVQTFANIGTFSMAAIKILNDTIKNALSEDAGQ